MPIDREGIKEALGKELLRQNPDALIGDHHVRLSGGVTPQSAGCTLGLEGLADAILALRPDGGGVPAGWRLVPDEPTAKMIAEVIVQTGPAALGDYELARQAASLLPPSPHPNGPDVLAELARDYRNMLAAAPSPPEGEG